MKLVGGFISAIIKLLYGIFLISLFVYIDKVSGLNYLEWVNYKGLSGYQTMITSPNLFKYNKNNNTCSQVGDRIDLVKNFALGDYTMLPLYETENGKIIPLKENNAMLFIAYSGVVFFTNDKDCKDFATTNKYQNEITTRSLTNGIVVFKK